MVLIEAEEDQPDFDPIAEYVLLGDSLSDGLLAWVTVGIDTSSSYDISAAATLTENGGVADSRPRGGPPPS